MRSPFEEGQEACSAYDNPYWINYPKSSLPEDEISARRWIDGYVSKCIMWCRGRTDIQLSAKEFYVGAIPTDTSNGELAK